MIFSKIVKIILNSFLKSNKIVSKSIYEEILSFSESENYAICNIVRLPVDGKRSPAKVRIDFKRAIEVQNISRDGWGWTWNNHKEIEYGCEVPLWRIKELAEFAAKLSENYTVNFENFYYGFYSPKLFVSEKGDSVTLSFEECLDAMTEDDSDVYKAERVWGFYYNELRYPNYEKLSSDQSAEYSMNLKKIGDIFKGEEFSEEKRIFVRSLFNDLVEKGLLVVKPAFKDYSQILPKGSEEDAAVGIEMLESAPIGSFLFERTTGRRIIKVPIGEKSSGWVFENGVNYYTSVVIYGWS